MTKEQFAKNLHGRQYGDEISTEEESIAKENGLVVVFGYSDDNAELRGAIHDEIGCYDGGDIWIAKQKDGKYVVITEEQKDSLEYFGNKFHTIKAVWSPEEPACSWIYETEIPHVTFDILEEGELYCRGIVFSLTDL